MTNEMELGRVVLVSVDFDWRNVLGAMLRHAGIEVSELDEPDRIQEHVRGAALVVTNHPVRLSDGRTVTECIRATPAMAHLPILNATTHVLPQELDAAEQAGVTQSLILPATMQQLKETVIAMLRLSERARRAKSGAGPAVNAAILLRDNS